MQRRDLLKSSATGAAVLGFPTILKAQQQYRAEYKMSTVVPPSFAWGKGGEIFANLVRERTNGRINIKQYPGASLVQGQQDREFAAMRQGIIDVLCGAPINWSGTVKECGIFAMPFLMPDHKAYDAVVASDAVQKDFFDIIRKAGAEPLAIGETGYRQLSNSKRPVRKPEDLKGLKIRMVASPMYLEIMSGMGANPTAMSWADAQPALASGAVDGQENPMSVIMAAKFDQVQKHLSLTGHVYSPAIFLMNKASFDKLSAADKQVFLDAAKEAVKANRARVDEDDAKGVSELRSKGMTVVENVDKAKFQAALTPVYAEFEKQFGKANIDRIRNFK